MHTDGQGYVVCKFFYKEWQGEYHLYIGPFVTALDRFQFMEQWGSSDNLQDARVTFFCPCPALPRESGVYKHVIEPAIFKGFMPVFRQMEPRLYLARMIQRSGLDDDRLASICRRELHPEDIAKLREGKEELPRSWSSLSYLLGALRISPSELGYKLEPESA
jgi:hypothetical protein